MTLYRLDEEVLVQELRSGDIAANLLHMLRQRGVLVPVEEPLWRKCAACDGKGLMPDPYRNGTCQACMESGYVRADA